LAISNFKSPENRGPVFVYKLVGEFLKVPNFRISESKNIGEEKGVFKKRTHSLNEWTYINF